MPDFPPAVSSLSAGFVDALYAAYMQDPISVPADWRAAFDRVQHGVNTAAPATSSLDPSFILRVERLVTAYRLRGHLAASLDPLGASRPRPAWLDPGTYGFSGADLRQPLPPGLVPPSLGGTLGEVVERLERIYCGSLAVQTAHIDDEDVRRWIHARLEEDGGPAPLAAADQRTVLRRLTEAAVFEDFLRERYPGVKTFSLSGAETLLPMLAFAMEDAADAAEAEIVMAMAHRGRLNVLVNALGMDVQRVFEELEDADPDRFDGRGDVKYHLGYSRDWRSAKGNTVHVSLCFNPSHLEFVNAVAMGRLRAKQDRFAGSHGNKGLLLLIHGDAAFAGQGIVPETMNMSGLAGYRVGGALHIILNNQIGFTTLPEQGRTSKYAADVAKFLPSPIFHVNGDDPEAAIRAVRMALAFRRTFRRDVVIDLYGYRRFGHNEGDEPAYTQPLTYEAIGRKRPVREVYLDQVTARGTVDRAEADAWAAACRRSMEEGLRAARTADGHQRSSPPRGIWQGYFGGPEPAGIDVLTGVDRSELVELLHHLARVPAGFHIHPKLARWLTRRQEMARGERPVDWATAESLAFATLAAAGHRVRLTGQDSERGTFSQRHAVWHDGVSGRRYAPLQHVAPNQAPVDITNSPLSEAAVLGFEYGYSLDCPEGLILWEAQFGDFANVAQVIIDQFIAAAEDKWNRLSGIVLLLPHGFEGQGPEHSSARPERFLQLAADHHMQVVYPTTPAQYFHCLRRQVLRRWRKPLVIMTPKSLLRHPLATSSLDDFTGGRFLRVLRDTVRDEAAPIQRILLCWGKVYYDLLQRREAAGRSDVTILRMEQAYPFPEGALRRALADLPAGLPVVWVQEEPANMGAWPYLRATFGERMFGRPLWRVSRPEAASPATASPAAHRMEQEKLLDLAFGEEAQTGPWSSQ